MEGEADIGDMAEVPIIGEVDLGWGNWRKAVYCMTFI